MNEEKMNFVPKRIILIPVDNSVHTSRALTWYYNNIMRPDDELHMIHVVEPLYNSFAIGYGIEAVMVSTDDVYSRILIQLDNGKNLLKEYVHILKEKGVKCKGFMMVDSKIGETIIKVSDEHKVDIILIGNRGEGFLKRTFLGSVSD